jgi:2,3-diketo-5-methylthio-1-phosphopentane phosphatase
VRHRLPADVLLLATVTFWSFNFTATRYGVTHGFQPLTYSVLRFGTGALVFAAFTYARERTLRVARRDVLLLLVAAALGIWINQVAFVYGVKLATAATFALIFGTLPVFVALISLALGVEHVRLRHWLAAAISFTGVALVALGSSGGLGGGLGGILLGLAAAGSWAGYSVAMRPLMQRYSPYRISAFVLLAGFVPLAATAAPSLARQDWAAPNALAWGAAVYGLIFSLLVTNILWFTAIDRVGPARSSLYANLQPFLGAFFALVVLSEAMTELQVAGGAVIAAGIVVARFRALQAARKRTLVLDFDGTITEQDLLDEIAQTFGDIDVYREVDEGLDEQRLSLHEVLEREFEPVRAPLDEVVGWVLENVRVRPGFRELTALARERGWRLVIVSSGFHELIEPVLAREGLVDVELLANRVDPDPSGWRVRFRDEGSCGTCGEPCKRATVDRLSDGGEVVYVGDGYSDRCAAEQADLVFARRGLADYLRERGVPFVPFEDFLEIARRLDGEGPRLSAGR